MDRGGKLIVFSAPSGSGKTTIVRHLLKQEVLNLAFSISATSREPRDHEKDGADYYFMSLKEFKQHIKNGDFLEWEEVYRDSFYGTLKSEVERLWAEGKHIIFDIDVKGAMNIKKAYPREALAVFVKPPSLKALEKRLRARRTEDENTLEKRLARAADEMAYENKFDVVLVNDVLDDALAKAELIVRDFINNGEAL